MSEPCRRPSIVNAKTPSKKGKTARRRVSLNELRQSEAKRSATDLCLSPVTITHLR